jgi:hypothetical protein
MCTSRLFSSMRSCSWPPDREILGLDVASAEDGAG